VIFNSILPRSFRGRISVTKNGTREENKSLFK
jgi:hypothetical protein